MKNLVLITVIYLLSNSITASNAINVKFKVHDVTAIDSVKFDYEKKLQETVNLFLNKKIFSFEDESFYANDLLGTKDVAETFAKILIFAQYPVIKNSSYELHVSEDNSKKLWFVYVRVPSSLDGQIFLIIVKNNCKVLFFNNFCCPKE